MKVFNYASYAREFEKGVPKPNMTKIAKALFEPIVSLPDVVNRVGNPYVVDSKYAKAWYEQSSDIPENIKLAAGKQELIAGIGDYFAANILDVVVSQMMESKMYAGMYKLVRESDLPKNEITELLQLYDDNLKPEFLGHAFLLAVVADNTKPISCPSEEPIDEDIKAFKELVQKKYKKPKCIDPPDEIQDHEIGYVKELYRVYQEVSGEEYARPEDLDGVPALRRNFNRQRKDYYHAETIHMELRDTVRLDEEESFGLLKDEVYDGVIDTRDKKYDSGFDRLNAVMEHASIVPLSNNLNNITLDWVGAAEKKGVCHMLVNDKRLSWMEDDKDGK